MKTTYDLCLPLLLAHEGGYSNHPNDPGGPTNFGITIFDYRKYVKPGATAADVRAMTVEEAKRIYRTRYWDAQRCDELPAGLDYAVFDYGVNSGIGRSAKVLRRLLGLPDRSVAISDDVIGATHAINPTTLVTNPAIPPVTANLADLWGRLGPSRGRGEGGGVGYGRQTASL